MNIPLSSGLMQREDERSSNPPTLDIAKDVQFDELGGLQTRLPYAALGLAITGGGTIASADLRRIATFGDELVLFTRDALYSWIASSSTWTRRADHPAIVSDEKIVFASNGDQPYGDRAEVGGTILYTWVESGAVYYGAINKATGAILVPATLLSVTASRPRLVVTGTTIAFFVLNGASTLEARNIDPTSAATIIASMVSSYTISSTSAGYYDVCVGSGGVYGATCLTTNTSYLVFKFTGAAVTSSTKARTAADFGIGIGASGATLMVVRSAGSGVVWADQMSTAFADVRQDNVYNDTIPVANVSVVAASWNGGFDVWIDGSGFELIRFTITTSGTTPGGGRNFLGTGSSGGYMTMASSAFTDPSGLYSYIWIAQDPPIGVQGVYLLIRSDGLIVGKSTSGNATSQPLFGWHATVQSTVNAGEYAWLGCFKRTAVSLNNEQTARSPRDIVFSFDSNEARRCTRFGSGLYVSGCLPLIYDGLNLVEVGSLIAPWYNQFGDTGSTVSGGPSAGTYAFKRTTRWMSATGEVDRSTSIGAGTAVITANHSISDGGNCPEQWFTRKTNRTAEVWRTIVNPTADSPFYLTTAQLPSVTANPNRYVPDSKIGTTVTTARLATFVDALSDINVAAREQHPETGDVLENIQPPPFRIAAATNTRMFLSGIAGSPNAVWYSLYRAPGLVARFNDALAIDVPVDGGDITALAVLNETLIVFRESAIYAFAGDGNDDTGGGTNFASPHVVSIDVGAVNQDSIVTTDSGVLFQSDKGWHLLDRSLSVQYVGANVDDYDAETVEAAHIMPGQHQTRIITSGRVLIYDDVAKQWAEWSIADGIDGLIWQGRHYYLSSSLGPMRQQTTFVGVNYGMDVETAWIKVNDLQGMGRVRSILALGEYRGTHKLRIRVARDYEYVSPGIPNYFDDVTWTVSPTTVGSTEQVRHGPSRQRCSSIKIRITAVATDGISAPTSEALKLTGLALRVGVYDNTQTRLPAAQKD